MFESSGHSSESVPTQPAGNGTGTNKEMVRHLLFGSLSGVQETIRTLHKLGYAEPNDWSRPMMTGRPGEVMAILTKYRRSQKAQSG